MTYISIDSSSIQAKRFIELIETLPYAKILKEPNVLTKKAMGDAKRSKTRKHKNAKELTAFLNK